MTENNLSLEFKTEIIREKINRKFPKSQLHRSNYEEIFEVDTPKFKQFSEVADKTFFYDHKISIIKVPILLSLILVFIVKVFHKEIYEKSTESIAFWSIIIISMIIMIFTYVFFFKRKSICVKTTKEFLIINSKKKVLWTEILTTGIYKIAGIGQMETLVIIGTVNEIFRINVTESEISAKDLIQIINIHKNVT